VHIHTDEPEAVFSDLRAWGTLATHKAEDMHRQHETLVRSGGGAHGHQIRRPIALVTESATDLPPEVLRAHGITVVPLLLLDGTSVLRDGIDITSEAFHARLGETGPLPTTSQPAPGDFVTGFATAAELGEEILYLGLSSTLSGTFAAAEAAGALRGTEGPQATLHRFDTRAASILQGLMVQRAAELAELGLPISEILRRLERIRAHSGVMFTVDTFDRLLASGRVGRGKAMLGTLLGVKPILALNEEGRIEQAGKARGRKALMTGVLERLEAAIPAGTLRPRFGIVHVARPEIVAELEGELRARWGPNVEVLASPITPVLATHVGIGAWGLGWMVDPEEG
jgi:DegV family protein with EDD domain